jgi:pyridoxal phosphate enzyme (YggS family)
VHSIADGTPQSVIQITEHLAELRNRVRAALTRSDRDADEILIVAVSKKQPVELIEAVYRAGQFHFGENFVQEAAPKIQRLQQPSLQWHFIGRIQANKTRAIAEHFQWVHTIDRLHVAKRLNAQRPRHAPPLNVFIQVNVDDEPQKAGVHPGEVEPLARAIATFERLRLRGLMILPAATGSVESNRSTFRALRALQRELLARGLPLDSLSMGMSADFEVAIEEGSTCIRIGTAVFGPRPE